MEYKLFSGEIDEEILNVYTFIDKIGIGYNSCVYKAENRQTKCIVTIKKANDPFKVSKDAKKIYKEIALLDMLGEHPNITFLKNVLKIRLNVYIILEYQDTNLYSLMKSNLLSDLHKKYIVYQLFKVLKYIHSANVIHRDLKPTNILVNRDCTIKLTDFGLAVIKGDSLDNDLTDYVTMRYYKSPEIILGSKLYDQSSDLWSLGCIIAELYTGKILFKGHSTVDQLEQILKLTGRPTQEDVLALKSSLAQGLLENVKSKGRIDCNEYFKDTPAEIIEIIYGLLNFNPSKRLTSESALRLDYFKDFHDESEEYTYKGTINLLKLDDNIEAIDSTENLGIRLSKDSIA